MLTKLKLSKSTHLLLIVGQRKQGKTHFVFLFGRELTTLDKMHVKKLIFSPICFLFLERYRARVRGILLDEHPDPLSRI